MRRHSLMALLALSTCLAASASAKPTATLKAAFTPERLGRTATVSIDLRIADPPGPPPAPLREVTVRYPAGLQLGLSGLGISACAPARLEAEGRKGCPTDSFMGEGSALAEIPLGAGTLHETAHVTIVRGPERDGHFALLFLAEGSQPVIARLVFTGLLLPAPAPFGGRIQVDIPQIESASSLDVTIVELHLALGSAHLTYYERVRGHTIAYHPVGIALPQRCPQGGFPFSATMAFQDRHHASASADVPCPPHR